MEEYFVAVFVLMLLCHCIDDFVLQSACLSKLKTKEFWMQDGKIPKLYEHDYRVSLFIHGLEWSLMVSLPILIFSGFQVNVMFLVAVVANAFIHALIDHAKANRGELNLLNDQIIHFMQIIMTFVLFMEGTFT